MQLTNITAREAAGTQIDKEGPSEHVLRNALFDILGSNTLCSMATVTADGRAHINTAYFCYSEELDLYFLSHPRSIHCQNLQTNSSLSMAIFSSAQKWATCDVGVQLFGTCIKAEGAEAEKASELYGKRFVGYAEWNKGRSGVAAEYRFYRFAVLRLRILDEAHFGDGVIVSATVQSR